MRKEKIYLPILKRVRITNYSLFKEDIDYEFMMGLNLIIGGNGVGKTTFINIIKYALVGLYKKDLDVKVYKGEKRLIRGKYANCNTFFRNRTLEKESDKYGYVELWFEIKDKSFYIKRSLFDVKIEEAKYIYKEKEYEIDGKSLKQDSYKGYYHYSDNNDNNNLQYNYEKIVAQTSNLSDFEDLIFFVNQILFFGESRENVLWSKSVQERLLSSFINNPTLEKKRKEYAFEAKYQDSISRHKQEEIKAIKKVLNQINTDSEYKNDRLELMSEIERLNSIKNQLENDRDRSLKKISSLYKINSNLNKDINVKEKEKEALSVKIKNKLWIDVNPKYGIYQRQYRGNAICPMCNSDIKDKLIKVSSDECFLCHTKITHNEEELRKMNDIELIIDTLVKKRKNIEENILIHEE